jgi:hypothetical protein
VPRPGGEAGEPGKGHQPPPGGGEPGRRFLTGLTACALWSAPAILALGLYAPALGVGYLADDFLYLDWMRSGWGVLLRHVTTSSLPQMIRPLPALAWALGALRDGPVLLHALSLFLHALAGLLVAVVIGRAAAPPAPAATPARAAWRSPGSKGVLFAVLFVAFPLSSEPVVWLSASPDLWATVLALLATCFALRADGRRWHQAAAVALFLLALLSKESVLCLPLALALLLPWREAGRTVGMMAGGALAYLGLRVIVFRGPGGYLDAGGRSALWSVRPGELAHALFLQLPLRVLVPLRGAREAPRAELVAGLLSALLLASLLAAILASGRKRAAIGSPPGWGRWNCVRPWLAGLAALLPALPVFTVEVDQENSRLLYFPAAVLAVALGLLVPAMGSWARRIALLLALCWSGATAWNVRPWIEAGWEVEHTLAMIESVAPRFPPRALVFVAGHDTWHGALAWRNAIAAAAWWRGVRPDLRWFLGTVAGVDRPGDELGKGLFEIGIDRAGRPVDWTPCEEALLPPPKTVLGSFPVDWKSGRDPVTPGVAFGEPLPALQVRLELASGRPAKPVAGRLFWRPARGGRFNMTDSAAFVIGPRAAPEIVLRVPAELAPRPRALAGIILWLHLPREGAEVRTVEVAAAPAVCEAPRNLRAALALRRIKRRKY